MASSLPEKPLCESPFAPTSNGCCADGRRCDEVCIAVIASLECKEAHHVTAVDSDCELEQYTLDEQVACSEQDSCCADEENVCTSKGTADHCTANSDENAVNPCVPFSTVKDSCCKSKGKPTSTCGSKKGLTLKSDQCKVSSSSECCSVAAPNANQQTTSQSHLSNTCCDSKDNTSVSKTEQSLTGQEFSEGCSFHLTEAMKKYKAYLEAGLCICRSALKRVDVCCDQTNRAAISKKRKILSTFTSHGASEIITNKPCRLTDVQRVEANNGCSAVKSVDNNCCSTAISIGKTGCSGSKPDCKTDCSSDKSVEEVIESCNTPQSGCCSSRRDRGCDTNDRVDALCESVAHEKVIPTKSPSYIDATGRNQDLEQNAAREHVTFSITGMTCTGCVKKVLGVLNHVDGVDNIEVNFVAGIGGFDNDTAKITASAALRRLEKETGFKCSRIVSDCQTLDLDMPSTLAQRFAADPAKGIESIEKVRKVYRVSYDPEVIGARTVLAAFGGRIAPPSNDSAVSEGRRRVMLMLLSFFGATVFTIPVCVLAFSNLPVTPLTKGIVELVLATLVQLIAVREFYAPALKALIFSKNIEMDMLVVISITAAYGYSIVAFGIETAGIDLEQGTLFETSTLLITLVLLGRLVANYAKVRAVQAVSLRSLQAETAILENINGETTEIDARLLEFRDIIRVPAHSKIVSDGEIISGESAVDESMLTGESLPVPKATGDIVTAGTLNGTGILRVRLTRLPGKNSITDIADMVQNALNSKPRIQDLADVVAGYFVPVVMSIAIVVFAIWIAIALRVRSQSAGGAIGTAITYAIAVLAVSCPCALGLAVPMVLVISGGVAARGGVIIKQADAMERGFKVTDIVFDKTGTLTTGQLEVTQQVMGKSNLSTEQALAIAYALVRDDGHPVSQAVAAKLKSQDISPEVVEELESIPGCGIQAIWQGQQAKAGNPYWLGVDTSDSITTLQAEGYTLLCVTIERQLLISFGLKAKIRPEAKAVVNELHTRGLTCHIVSGDHPTSVSNIASSLGIHANNIVSRQSPADKHTFIETLKSTGKTTLFIGDGTNDAIAIAAAHIGVQIGTASDITRATADVVLLGGLEGLITLLDVSKQSFYRIVFNFVWAGVYNVFAILLASGAFVKVRIAPNYAGLGEIVSVLPVVLAALTMLRVRSTSVVP